MRRARLLAVTITLAVAVGSARAQAQCSSNASSCVECHEARGEHPTLGDGRPWHDDHGFGDLCVACHGGDPAAASRDEAHGLLREPLADVPRSCGGCHAEDATERAARYRAASAPPASPASVVPPSPGNRPGAEARAGVDRALALVAVLLAALVAGLVASERRALGGFRLIAWLRATTWSAYAAGAGLGLTVAASEVLYGRPIAAAGAFDKLAAYLGRALFPESPYYAYVMRPEITWQVWLMLGALLGSFASARLAGTARLRWLPDEEWTERFGTSRSVRLLVAFFGAMLVQLGAGIAGGCTSGLAISGGALLSPAAFVFMGGMFASGIPTAWLWGRLRREKR